MKRVFSLAIIALAAFAIHANAAAAGDAIVAFAPSSASTTPGSSVAIDITVANVDASPGLANYDLTLHWDPALVRLDSLQDSGFVRSGGNLVVCATGAIDNAGGSVEAQCQAIPLSGAPGVSAGGPVALLHGSFTALAMGTSPLTLSGTLAGPSSTAIPATFSGGSIQVTNASSASPSPAATATATELTSATSTPPPVATATSTLATNPTAAASATTEAVTLPDTGDGGSASTWSWYSILIALVAAVPLLTGLGVALRQSWRSHTRSR